ncbi:MAG: hypothetical protein ABI850_08440 [Flavobacterium sp.]
METLNHLIISKDLNLCIRR